MSSKHNDDSVVVYTNAKGQDWIKIRCARCGRLSAGTKLGPLMSDTSARLEAEAAATIDQRWYIKDGTYTCDRCNPKHGVMQGGGCNR